MTGRRSLGIADLDEDPNVEIRPYSSPPCYAHEIDPAYFGLAPNPQDTVAGLRRMLAAIDAAASVLADLLSRR
jgi:hypothetical protein